jgi:single-strand DNA-binding protein
MFSATITGRLGSVPETRSLPTGKTVTSFRIATDYGFGDKKKTTWVKAVIWGEQGERAAAWLGKGGRAAITGDVYMEEWEGKEGKQTTLCMDVRSFENLEPKRQEDPPPRRQSTGRDTGTRRETAPPIDDEDVLF